MVIGCLRLCAGTYHVGCLRLCGGILLYMCWIGIWIMCAFEIIWFDMHLSCNFHDGVHSQENIYLWLSEYIYVMVYSHEILYFLWASKLSWKNFMMVSSHENPTSHEITSWRWALTKYTNSHEMTSWRWALTKYINSHEITSWQWALTKEPNSHEITSWRWALTKCQTITE
jgi:hypothetical protein